MLGNSYNDLDCPLKSLEHYERALGLMTANDGPTLEVTIRSNMGSCYFHTGDLEGAKLALEEALGLSRSLDWDVGIAYNCMNLGDCYKDLGQPDKAKSLLLEAIGLFGKMQSDEGLGLARATLAEVLVQLGEFDDARLQLKAADDHLRNAGDQFKRALIQCSWVRFHLARGDHSAAKVALSRAEALYHHVTTSSDTYLQRQIERAAKEVRESIL
jgi:tetratricopeptide (TPR) repeat protein